MDSGERTRDRRRWGAGILLPVILLALIGVSIGANSWKGELLVKEVRTRGTSILQPHEVLALASVKAGQRLYDVDLEGVRRRVETNPFVQDAAVTRDIPGQVTILVHERKPVAALLADRLWYVDDSACVMPAVLSDKLYDLPFVTGSVSASEPVAGKRIPSDGLRSALALLDAAKRVGEDLCYRISEVHVAPDGNLICSMAEMGVPVNFGHDNIPERLVKLDSFWKEYVARRGTQDLLYVDLRFEDQVVARWKQQ